MTDYQFVRSIVSWSSNQLQDHTLEQSSEFEASRSVQFLVYSFYFSRGNEKRLFKKSYGDDSESAGPLHAQPSALLP